MVSAWRNFKNIFSRPLFTIIFRPEMLKFHPYSILTEDTMVGFVIFCVLRNFCQIGYCARSFAAPVTPSTTVVTPCNTTTQNFSHMQKIGFLIELRNAKWLPKQQVDINSELTFIKSNPQLCSEIRQSLIYSCLVAGTMVQMNRRPSV